MRDLFVSVVVVLNLVLSLVAFLADDFAQATFFLLVVVALRAERR